MLIRQTWIRSPWWDCLWILSGMPLGLVFLCCLKWGVARHTIVLFLVLLTQTGHLLSPLALAWSHARFRQVMRQRRVKYLLAPLGIVVGCTLAAFVSSIFFPDIRFDPINVALIIDTKTPHYYLSPFVVMVWVYGLWNAYHFGMQAFGVMSIYRNKAGICGPEQRRIDRIYCCFVTWATMLIPFVPHMAKFAHDVTGLPPRPHPFLDYVQTAYVALAVVGIAAMMRREWRVGVCLPRILFIATDGIGMIMAFRFGLWGFAIVSMNYWLVAIGLASHVHANSCGRSPYLFALGLMAAGFILFCLMFVDLGAVAVGDFSTRALHFTMTVVGLRLALGFVHFLYDRWLYKFSDPDVRATIGADLFKLQSGQNPARGVRGKTGRVVAPLPHSRPIKNISLPGFPPIIRQAIIELHKNQDLS